MEVLIDRFRLHKHIEAIGQRTDLATIGAELDVLHAANRYETAVRETANNFHDPRLLGAIAARDRALVRLHGLPSYIREQDARVKAQEARERGDSEEERIQLAVISDALLFRGNGQIIAKKIFHGEKAQERMQETGFVVYGRNETATIRNLTHINGIPINTLEEKLRDGTDPNDPEDIADYQEVFGDLFPDPSKFGSHVTSSYECIFLGPQESLLELMAKDNDTVLGMGLRHMQLADFLDTFVYHTNMMQEEVEGKKYGRFTINGNEYSLSEYGEPGSLGSPFDDGLAGHVTYFVTRGDGARIQFGQMQPDLIQRWGFYEGERTAYRLDPKNLAVFAGLMPAERV